MESKKLFDASDLNFIWQLIRKNLLILILLPIIAYALGEVYSYRLPNMYGAKTQLLLKSNETYDYQDPIYKGLGAYGVYMDVRNQIRILQSKDLIEEVLEKMDIGISYYVKGRMTQTEVFGTLPFQANIDLINRNIYEMPIDITVNSIDEYTFSYETSGGSKKIKAKFDETFVNEDILIRLDKNYDFNEQNIGRVKGSEYQLIVHSKNNLISRYQSKINVENIEHTSILDVNISDNISNRAKTFLDTLNSVFINFSTRSQIEINENTLANIEKQLGEVIKIINDIEFDLLNYKDENQILDLSREEEEYFNQYVFYSKQERELGHKKNSVISLENYIINLDDERILSPSFYILENDFYLQKHISEIYELQLELNQIKSSFTENNPNYDIKVEQLQILKKDILSYIVNLKIALDDEIKQTQAYLGKYAELIKSVPRSKQGIENIKRELEVNNKMYLFLLERKTNTLIARAGIIPQVQVIEEPFPVGIIGPNKSKIVGMYFIGGLVLAFFIAIVRKLFFERIENVDELKKQTDISVVGGIPTVDTSRAKIVVQDMPKSSAAESFRTIRTNLSFMGEGKNKVITLSSLFPSEGKTFCSVNLATILANTDKRVLIIDLDMHKPKVHKMLELDNFQGVSNLLTDQINFDSIEPHEVSKNLFVYTCGPIPPNPSELITRTRMSEFIDWCKERYDYVICDTPPFGLLNDAIEITSLSDVFFVVLNTKFARARGVKKIEEQLENIQVASKGFVLNEIKQSKFQYYYSKYAYKYGYGYGYGYKYGYGSDEYGYVNED